MNKIQEALERVIKDLDFWCETYHSTAYMDPTKSLKVIINRAKQVLEEETSMEEIDPSLIIKDGDCIHFFGEKYKKVKEPPRMQLENQGEFSVVSYDGKIYYRLEYPSTPIWWSRSVDNSALEMVKDKETERLLQMMYLSDIHILENNDD